MTQYPRLNPDRRPCWTCCWGRRPTTPPPTEQKPSPQQILASYETERRVDRGEPIDQSRDIQAVLGANLTNEAMDAAAKKVIDAYEDTKGEGGK